MEDQRAEKAWFEAYREEVNQMYRNESKCPFQDTIVQKMELPNDNSGEWDEVLLLFALIMFSGIFKSKEEESDMMPITDEEIMTKVKELVDLNNSFSNPVSQSVYLWEEMGELVKEIGKMERHKGNPYHVKEEMADVITTILTFAYSIGLDMSNIRQIIMKKLDRGIKRLNAGEQ